MTLLAGTNDIANYQLVEWKEKSIFALHFLPPHNMWLICGGVAVSKLCFRLQLFLRLKNNTLYFRLYFILVHIFYTAIFNIWLWVFFARFLAFIWWFFHFPLPDWNHNSITSKFVFTVHFSLYTFFLWPYIHTMHSHFLIIEFSQLLFIASTVAGVLWIRRAAV